MYTIHDYSPSPCPPHPKMRWILGCITVYTWIIGVFSQEVFTVGTDCTHENGCGMIPLYFLNGVPPYSIYYSAAHQTDNYNTWSEEILITTHGEGFPFGVASSIGMSIPQLRYGHGVSLSTG
jgi:hypothetical protein